MTHTDLSSKQIGNFINKTNHRLMKATDTTENAYKVQNYSTTCVYYGVLFKQLLFHPLTHIQLFADYWNLFIYQTTK